IYLHQAGRFDGISGLLLFRNRDYSPALGSWIEQDPAGFAAGYTDLYLYLGNHPANLDDPSGLGGVVTKPQTRPWITSEACGALQAIGPSIASADFPNEGVIHAGHLGAIWPGLDGLHLKDPGCPKCVSHLEIGGHGGMNDILLNMGGKAKKPVSS